jgi:AraC-like DNA-binding protein
MTVRPSMLAEKPQLTNTGAPGGGTALLDSTLDRLRLEGAIFFRSELTEAFAFESTPLALADAFHPGAQRLILFHIVAEGSCWVAGDDGERHWARQGDVIVLPYGDRHTIGGEAPADAVPILTLIGPPPWDEIPFLRHGGGGSRTELVCGYLYSEDPLFDPSMRALPPVLVVHLPAAGASRRWIEASIAYALEHTSGDQAPGPVTTRLPELMLIEVLRAHLATAPGLNEGWLAALRDPVLAPALSLLHSSPERKWTVADLATGAAVSRSLLDERFRDVLGRSPIRYLTEWRMHMAEELLATTDIGVAAIARRVGYDSEEAFSRAFKRARGRSPSHWRSERSTLVPRPAAR